MNSSHARPCRLALALSLCLAAATAPRAQQTQLELGKMWLFENPPLAYLEEEYGFKPTKEWFDALRLASLRFGNWCSASFVSPKGLIMTNHHCVRDNIADVSPPGTDWVKNGFYATAIEDEVKIAGLTVQQLVGMEDVTAKMLEGITADDDDTAAEAKRAANEQQILAGARERHDGLAQVVTLHQGAAFHLYLYKVYDDIRLVCSPHLQSAHYGGDPDNFTYPRYSIDFSFCRAYEDGKPADTSKHYFRWSKAGAKSGDLVFVTGNPGSTGRLLTYAQMEYMRDADYPTKLGMLESRLAILRAFAEQDKERGVRLRQIILGDENSVKALGGYLSGLLDDELMADKRKFEEQFKAKVAADPELQKKFGGVWDRLAEIAAEKTKLEPKLFFQEPSYSGHLGRAVAIVRAVDPEVDEQERGMARAQALGQPIRWDPLFAALFINHLARAVKWLGDDDPYIKAVMGGRDPQAATQALVETSRINDAEFVSGLLEGGAEAVAKSDDPAIAAARVITPLLFANAERAEKLAAQEAVQNRLIGQALFAVYGDKISPDATMTLRFSDGRVEGYAYNGTVAPYRTTFYGLYARNVEFDNQYPFDIPDVWKDRADDIDMTKAVNFVSTNDIIGGNSGSPVVDKDLNVVGLIFDGNIEQLPNRFLFRDKVERSVSVHVDAIIESMTVIYNAKRVVEELTGHAGN